MKEVKKLKTLTLYDEDGNAIECEVVMSYACQTNGKEYIFYTDNSYDENGDLNLYASRYLGMEDGNMQLEEIDSEEEWSLLDVALEEAKKGIEG